MERFEAINHSEKSSGLAFDIICQRPMRLGIDTFWIVERFIKLFGRFPSPLLSQFVRRSKTLCHLITIVGIMWLNWFHIQLPMALIIAIVETSAINHATLRHLLSIDLIEKISLTIQNKLYAIIKENLEIDTWNPIRMHQCVCSIQS